MSKPPPPFTAMTTATATRPTLRQLKTEVYNRMGINPFSLDATKEVKQCPAFADMDLRYRANWVEILNTLKAGAIAATTNAFKDALNSYFEPKAVALTDEQLHDDYCSAICHKFSPALILHTEEIFKLTQQGINNIKPFARKR